MTFGIFRFQNRQYRIAVRRDGGAGAGEERGGEMMIWGTESFVLGAVRERHLVEFFSYFFFTFPPPKI
jgi:hypothetical protein